MFVECSSWYGGDGSNGDTLSPPHHISRYRYRYRYKKLINSGLSIAHVFLVIKSSQPKTSTTRRFFRNPDLGKEGRKGHRRDFPTHFHDAGERGNQVNSKPRNKETPKVAKAKRAQPIPTIDMTNEEEIQKKKTSPVPPIYSNGKKSQEQRTSWTIVKYEAYNSHLQLQALVNEISHEVCDLSRRVECDIRGENK